MKLHVREGGKCLLAYKFRTSEEAAEVYRILRDYFPKAQFVFEQAERQPAAPAASFSAQS
ncbi:MAG: hypothetical protein AAF416_08485 [Pseudomonadota bacterium]